MRFPALIEDWTRDYVSDSCLGLPAGPLAVIIQFSCDVPQLLNSCSVRSVDTGIT